MGTKQYTEGQATAWLVGQSVKATEDMLSGDPNPHLVAHLQAAFAADLNAVPQADRGAFACTVVSLLAAIAGTALHDLSRATGISAWELTDPMFKALLTRDEGDDDA